MKFGRFAVYFEGAELESLRKKKLDVVLSALERLSKGAGKDALDQPDGAFRVIGPIKGRNAAGLVIVSPFPPLFEILLRSFKNSLRKDLNGFIPKWLVGLEIPNIEYMMTVGIYKVSIIKSAVGFKWIKKELKAAAAKANMYLGFKIKDISYELLESHLRRRNGLKGYFILKALDSYTAFIVNYLRYTGIGENLTMGNGDVIIERVI